MSIYVIQRISHQICWAWAIFRHHIRIHFEKYLTRDSRQFTVFKKYFTKSVGPGRFSAEKLNRILQTDRRTDRRINQFRLFANAFLSVINNLLFFPPFFCPVPAGFFRPVFVSLFSPFLASFPFFNFPFFELLLKTVRLLF